MADEMIEEILEAGENVQDASMSSTIVGNEASTGGVGNLLYSIHSKHWKTLFLRKEETNLKFYDHVVVATHTSQLWCFPKTYRVNVIPRFKIVDATITLGPKSIPKLITFLIVVTAAILIGRGLVNGGYEWLIFGILLLIPLPFMILIPLFKKWQYIYLSVRKPATKIFNRGGVHEHIFRLKKTGFDVASDTTDQNFIVKYVYGALGMGGTHTTNEAHIFSHLNNASLATPIMPVYADKTIGEFCVPTLLQRKIRNKGDRNKTNKVPVGNGHHHVVVTPGTPPLTPVKNDHYG